MTKKVVLEMMNTTLYKVVCFWRDEAISNMDKSMCITIDEMDQNTMTLPRYKHTPPSLEGKCGLNLHLCEVLVHGYQPRCDVWIEHCMSMIAIKW